MTQNLYYSVPYGAIFSFGLKLAYALVQPCQKPRAARRQEEPRSPWGRIHSGRRSLEPLALARMVLQWSWCQRESS